MKNWIVSLVFGLSLAGVSQADTCNSGAFCQQRLRVVQPVYRQQAVQVVAQLQAPYYYSVGQARVAQAQAVSDFRLSPEYLEFVRQQGYIQRVQEDNQRLEMELAMMQAQSGGYAPQQEEVPTDQPPAEEIPTQLTFAQAYPILATKCLRCHSGDDPKGGLWLDGTVALNGSGPDDFAKRGLILEMAHTEQMPKGGPPLTPQEKFDLAHELFINLQMASETQELPEQPTPPVPVPTE